LFFAQVISYPGQFMEIRLKKLMDMSKVVSVSSQK